MVICSRDDDSPSVTDYYDDLIIIFSLVSMHFVAACLGVFNYSRHNVLNY